MTPRYSIVIPAYNSESTLEHCLSACLAQKNAPSYEVIVVDDGSSDRTGAIATQHNVKLVWQENAGPASARNAGWRQARGQIVCFTDSDCAPSVDWLSRFEEEFTHSDCDAIGGSYTHKSDSLLGSLVHREILWRHQGMTSDSNFLGSFNLAVKKDVLRKLNGFNPHFRRASGEDNDLSYRMVEGGYKLRFCRAITVEHLHAWTLWSYLRSQARHGFWRTKIYRLHFKMVKGDQYASGFDFLVPPLSILSMALVVAAQWFLAGVTLAALILCAARRDPGLWVLNLIRSYFRGAGMVLGFAYFWLLGRKS